MVLLNSIKLDRNRNDGGVLVYIWEDIPSKELENHLPSDIEKMSIELNLRKTKSGCFFGYCHPQSQSDNFLPY